MRTVNPRVALLHSTRTVICMQSEGDLWLKDLNQNVVHGMRAGGDAKTSKDK